MDPQSCGSPNFGNFGTPTLESRDKMLFGCWSRSSQGVSLNSLFFCCFHFKLTFESIKEFGSASPIAPKNNKTKINKFFKKGTQASPMLKLHDGVHLHQKQQNKKIKRGGIEAPHLSILGNDV